MPEPTDYITKEYVEGCGFLKNEKGETIKQERVRVMSPFEIKQRAELNVANTTEAMRARVVAETSKTNGRNHVNVEIERTPRES